MFRSLFNYFNQFNPSWPYGDRVVEISHKYCSYGLENLFQLDVNVHDCSFYACKSVNKGGAINCVECAVKINNCQFYKCFAPSSACCYIEQSPICSITYCLFAENRANYIPVMQFYGDVTMEPIENKIENTNFTKNQGNFVSGLRIYWCTGHVKECIFSQNSANKSGVVYDLTMDPSSQLYDMDLFLNNTSEADSAALTLYHQSYKGCIQNTYFINNFCRLNQSSIIMQSDYGSVDINNCVFSGKRDEEVSCYYKESVFNVQYNCVFEKKESFDHIFSEIEQSVEEIDP